MQNGRERQKEREREEESKVAGMGAHCSAGDGDMQRRQRCDVGERVVIRSHFQANYTLMWPGNPVCRFRTT